MEGVLHIYIKKKTGEKAAEEVADAEGAVANGIRNFKVTHSGTNENEASATSNKLVQDFEHVNSETGLTTPNLLAEDAAEGETLQGSKDNSKVLGLEHKNPLVEQDKPKTGLDSVESEASAWDELDKYKPNILKKYERDPKYRKKLKGRNAQSMKTTRLPDDEYMRVMTLRITKKIQNGESLDQDYMDALELYNTHKIETTGRPDPLYLYLTQHYSSKIQNKGSKYLDEVTTTEHLKKQLTDGNKRMVNVAALGIILGVPSLIALNAVAINNHVSKTKLKSNLTSDGLVLTPDNATSSILNNDAPAHNTGTQPGNNKASGTATSPGTPEATHVHKVANSVTKHSRLNTKRAHRSKQTIIVYIVVIVATVLVLIAAGVFVLKMQHAKTKKADLFTDMNQYYATGVTKANSTMHTIYPNASLNQRNYLI